MDSFTLSTTLGSSPRTPTAKVSTQNTKNLFILKSKNDKFAYFNLIYYVAFVTELKNKRNIPPHTITSNASIKQ